jgi:two-component system chemotaxis sensor kinase CheA
MIDDDEEFLRDLMKTFREDAEERIKLLSQAVVELEAAGEGDAALAPIEVLFRETHSLKGASGAVEQAQMESVCQNVESVLAALKRGDLRLTLPVIDALSESVDCLHASLLAQVGADNRAAEVVRRLSTLADSAHRKMREESVNASAVAPSPGTGPARTIGTPSKSSSSQAAHAEAPSSGKPMQHTADAVDSVVGKTDTVRVSTSKLESIMLQAEEFISVKLAAGERSAALHDVSSRLEVWKREWYQARVSGDQSKIDEFLEWNSSFVDGLVADVRMLAKSADDERRTIGPMVNELLDGMKRILMLPVSSLLSSFPKMVRDLARTGEKQVEFAVTGADIEIDKRIIENLKDPLIHILRNSVDHGIESPEVRQSLGKPASGRIAITVSQLENNKIEICVSDDGAGIDVQQLRAVAQSEGLRTHKQLDGMDDAEVLRLAFASGISTRSEVSSVSGRGLGLAIVEQKVRQLGGSADVETQAGMGTLFRIHVPATLATARGILAQVSDRLFVVPVVGVDRVMRVHKEDVRMVENRETIQVEGHTLPLVYMHEVLDLPLKAQRGASDHIQALVAGSGDNRVAFAVDRILDEQEVLVKALGPQLVRVRNIAGVTVVGSGKVVPIINVVDLLQSAATRPVRGRRFAADTADDGSRRAVLIVEDSITSRMLLKNVLEAAGYYVRPTVDGVDALAALREEEFDLVVTDIEMPRMDGFELTRKIRSDPRLARIPVMLVTAMESQEHRELGLDVGANAYLPKSSFTQGTLLKTARSLL